MFKKEIYTVRVSGEKLNGFIKGSISGMIAAIANERVPHAFVTPRDSESEADYAEFSFKTTKHRYNKIMKVINKYYSRILKLSF